MPSRSKIENLCPEILDELEQRIINQNYNDFESIVEWLRAANINSINVENIYRHSLKLKKTPNPMKKIYAELEKAGIKPKCTNSALQSLLIRLGVQHLKEKRLVSQIVDISKFGGFK